MAQSAERLVHATGASRHSRKLLRLLKNFEQISYNCGNLAI